VRRNLTIGRLLRQNGKKSPVPCHVLMGDEVNVPRSGQLVLPG
jgi:hypothetical protein